MRHWRTEWMTHWKRIGHNNIRLEVFFWFNKENSIPDIWMLRGKQRKTLCSEWVNMKQIHRGALLFERNKKLKGLSYVKDSYKY